MPPHILWGSNLGEPHVSQASYPLKESFKCNKTRVIKPKKMLYTREQNTTCKNYNNELQNRKYVCCVCKEIKQNTREIPQNARVYN